ncbi:hypothetical protein U1Q18_028445 [Sarracenia purpurea var. burkii]
MRFRPGVLPQKRRVEGGTPGHAPSDRNTRRRVKIGGAGRGQDSSTSVLPPAPAHAPAREVGPPLAPSPAHALSPTAAVAQPAEDRRENASQKHQLCQQTLWDTQRRAGELVDQVKSKAERIHQLTVERNDLSSDLRAKNDEISQLQEKVSRLRVDLERERGKLEQTVLQRIYQHMASMEVAIVNLEAEPTAEVPEGQGTVEDQA